MGANPPQTSGPRVSRLGSLRMARHKMRQMRKRLPRQLKQETARGGTFNREDCTSSRLGPRGFLDATIRVSASRVARGIYVA